MVALLNDSAPQQLPPDPPHCIVVYRQSTRLWMTGPEVRRDDERAAAVGGKAPGRQASDITSLSEAGSAVQHCRRCPLYAAATRAVFGEGPRTADIMLVGEQPGDQEDKQGRPFVGPAGYILDEALAAAGIDRGRAYVTNAVKHFKFVPRGKRRLHQKPNAGEISACRFWLDLERAFVRPRVVVAMGATAVRGLLGRAATISSLRGEALRLDDGSRLVVTVHPSYLLRIRDEADKLDQTRAFEGDLARARTYADGH